ncbi:MAG: PAS domain S-box protein [Methanoregula sp.]
MDFDVRTSVLILFMVSCLLACLLIVYWKTQKTYPGFDFWTIGAVLVSAGSFFVLLRGVVPDSVSIILANILIITGILLWADGIRRFTSSKSLPVITYGILLPFSLLFFYFTYIHDSIVIRTLVLSAVLVPGMITAAIFVLRSRERENRLFSYAFAAVLILDAGLFAVRSLYWLFVGTPQTIFSQDEFNSLFFIISILADILIAGFFLMLNMVRTQTDLALSEERLRSTLASMDDLVFNLDENGVFTGSYNPVMENLFVSPEQFLGKTFREVLPRELAEQVGQAISEVKDTGKTRQIEYTLRIHGDLLWFNAKISPCYSPNGTFLGVTLVARNITGYKHAEEALRESEEKFRGMAERTSDLIFILDKNMSPRYVSPSSSSLIGYAPEELVGKPPEFAAGTIFSMSVQEFMDALKKNISGATLENLEMQITKKDGRAMYVNVHAIPILENGAFAGAQVSMRDITDRRLAEEALRQTNKKLNILSGITRHDINNKLLVLNSYIEMLQKNITDPSSAPYISKIQSASSQIGSLIRFTKEYEQVGVQAPKWQDLQKVIETARGDVTPGQVRLENDIPAGAELFSDPLIVKVFFNLVDNALRHGRTITTIRFSFWEKDGVSVIVCEDDGVGIAAFEKEMIFERGYGKNTGFGLAISREILGITGITIIENGMPGKGARFEMTVPKGAWRIARP